MNKSYNHGNKQKIKYQFYYHQIKLFVDNCGCEDCEKDGHRVICTDDIIEHLPHSDRKIHFNNGDKLPLDVLTVFDDGITNTLKVLTPNGACAIKLDSELYTYSENKYWKCFFCKGYFCKECFGQICPKCDIKILHKSMYLFYKHLSSKYGFVYEDLLSHSGIGDLRLIFDNGVLHDIDMYEWKIFRSDSKGINCLNIDHQLCTICDTYYCSYCFLRCPHSDLYRHFNPRETDK